MKKWHLIRYLGDKKGNYHYRLYSKNSASKSYYNWTNYWKFLGCSIGDIMEEWIEVEGLSELEIKEIIERDKKLKRNYVWVEPYYIKVYGEKEDVLREIKEFELMRDII